MHRGKRQSEKRIPQLRKVSAPLRSRGSVHLCISILAPLLYRSVGPLYLSLSLCSFMTVYSSYRCPLSVYVRYVHPQLSLSFFLCLWPTSLYSGTAADVVQWPWQRCHSQFNTEHSDILPFQRHLATVTCIPSPAQVPRSAQKACTEQTNILPLLSASVLPFVLPATQTPPSQVCFATLGRQMSDVDSREASWWRGGWPLASGLSLELCSVCSSASCAPSLLRV